MASLHSVYTKREKIIELAEALKNNPEMKGIEFTVSVNDDTNNYQQNVTMTISQTKEQRNAKEKKYYVGNGNTFWTDGKIQTFTKSSQETTVEDARVASTNSSLPPF